MSTPILMTGGTGTLGRLVAPLLRDAGRQLRILTRGSHENGPGIDYLSGDLVKNEGLGPALDGVKTVLHLAGGPKGDDTAAWHLVRAAKRAGVGHIVFVSVIAADAVPVKWFRTKFAAEDAISSSDIPFTTLRAAQFHDLVFSLATKMSKLPVVPAPSAIRFQPVDSRDVADRLAGLALAEPLGRVRDLAGPTVYPLPDLLRDCLTAIGRRRLMMSVPVPGGAGRAYRAGTNLSLVDADQGSRTWEAFLAARAGRPAVPTAPR
jgi:uncharacterized protein YbjT (DUF2867 family)